MSKVVTAASLDDAMEGLERTAMKLKRRHEKLLAALKKYTHCRHGCSECFCTKDASATVYEDDLYE